jgi:hypothetical protein
VSPPWATGSTSRSITFVNSITDPGQPWVMMYSVAPSTGERTHKKWMSTPSIVAMNCS